MKQPALMNFTATRLLLTCVLGSVLAACQTASPDLGAPMPDSDYPMLTDEQKAFIYDHEALSWFGLTPAKVEVQLAARDEEGIVAYVEALMETRAAAGFRPGQGDVDPIRASGIEEPLSITAEAASIPLNPQAGNFNGGTVLQPPMFDKYKREPGPISLHRYVHEVNGIPTFAGAPVAVRPADLIAGQVDVAFVGVPLGLGSGWRDSKNAPHTLRGMYGLGGYDVYGGVDPGLVLSLADYGNISTDRLSVERSMGHIREQVGQMLGAGVVPFIVGGDHSIMYASVAAMSDHYGEVSVLHLDAHYRGERDQDHHYSDRVPVSALIGESLLSGENLVQVGLRGGEMGQDDLNWLQEMGVQYHTMAQVEQQGWEPVMNRALSELDAGPVFISFDMSVLDPSQALGSGSPVPGGLTVREAQTLVRRTCAEKQVVGFEMLDVSPYLDISYQSAMTANYIMHACLSGIAARK